ncbi:MAG: hypothetical protein R3B09_01715 [Nannocystaceae bacterium]
MEEKRSIWWTIFGLVATGATGAGIGYWAANRQKPCACKAKLGEAATNGNGKKE